MPLKDVSALFVSPEATLREVLERSNATRRGIVLVVDQSQRLLGTVTDGDIRRAMLAGMDLALRAADFIAAKGAGRPPITASVAIQHADLVALVRRTGISQIPLLDDDGRVVRVVGLEDLLDEDEQALQAVVMAGGMGTRLQPLTEDLPKPMLPVGGKPVIEHIIRQLSDTGIRQVSVTTHYLREKIEQHFGDGRDFGVNLRYLEEESLLGTAGGLSLMAPPQSTLLVINGDILTRVDFRAMHSFHREHRAALTLAVREYEFQVPYGVVESSGPRVERVVEKPVQKVFVNAGIYLLERAVHALIPKGRRFEMTDLIRAAIDRGLTVVKFPVWEYWRDIGQPSDYLQAEADAKSGKWAR